MSAVGIKLTGQKALEKLLKQLPEKSRRGAVRKSVNAGSQVIVKAAKGKARQFKRSGALAKSITKVVRTGKDKQSIYAYVGPQSGFSAKFQGKTVIPALYVHLVEHGHLNSDGSFTPPKGFLRAAAAESEGAAAAAFTSKLGQAIEAEAAKLAKKRRSR